MNIKFDTYSSFSLKIIQEEFPSFKMPEIDYTTFLKQKLRGLYETSKVSVLKQKIRNSTNTVQSSSNRYKIVDPLFLK